VACQAVHYEDQHSSFNKVDYDSARDSRAAGNLPEFCRTSLTGKLTAPTAVNLYNAYVLECLAHEHCLGSAPA